MFYKNLTANLRKKLFQITLIHFVFLSVIVLLGLVHLRRSHTDLLAVLLDFLLAVGFEEGFQVTKLLFLGLFGVGFHYLCY